MNGRIDVIWVKFLVLKRFLNLYPINVVDSWYSLLIVYKKTHLKLNDMFSKFRVIKKRRKLQTFSNSSIKKSPEVTKASDNILALRKKIDGLRLLLKKTQNRNRELEYQLRNFHTVRPHVFLSSNSEKENEIGKKLMVITKKIHIAGEINRTYDSIIQEISKIKPFSFSSLNKNDTNTKNVRFNNVEIVKKKSYSQLQRMNTVQIQRPLSHFQSPRDKNNYISPRITGRQNVTARVIDNKNKQLRAGTKIDSPNRHVTIVLSPQKTVLHNATATGMKNTTDNKHVNKKFQKSAIPPIPVLNMDINEDKVKNSPVEKSDRETERYNSVFGTSDPEIIIKQISNLRLENSKLSFQLDQMDSEIQVLKQRKINLEVKMRSICKDDIKKVVSSKKNELENLKTDVNAMERNIRLASGSSQSITHKIFSIADIIECECTDLVKVLKNAKEFVKLHKKPLQTERPPCVPMLDLSLTSRNKLSLFMPKSSASLFESAISDDHSDDSLNLTLNLTNVPKLIHAPGSYKGFTPGTRSTRRVFSAFNASGLFLNVNKEVNSQEFRMFGSLLGGIFVCMYSVEIGNFPHVVRPAPAHHFLSQLSPTVSSFLDGFGKDDFKQKIFDHYNSSKEKLHLLAMSNHEIHELDDSFLQFVNIRNYIINLFTKNYTIDDFLDFFDHYLDLDADIACFIARDFVMISHVKNVIAQIIDKMIPYYSTMQMRIMKKVNDAHFESFIAWMMAFSTFYEIDQSTEVRNLLNSIITVNFLPIIVYANVPTGSLDKKRSSIIALLSIGKHIPMHFIQCATLQNNISSLVLEFMFSNYSFTTVCKVCCDFFTSVRPFIDKESIIWHMASFYKCMVLETYKPLIRVGVLLSLANVITAIIANREKKLTDLLLRLNFLQFIVRQFELEVFVSEKIQQPEQLREELKVVQPSRVSYLDIPSLKIPSILPKLNLDNPKLQLHFQPQRSSPFRTSVTITDRQYVDARKKRCLYMTQELHVTFIQLFFSILIDNTVHKLDINFVDPFPHVNRKLNVLYTLMCHMESQFNQDIARPLLDSFTPKVNHCDKPPLLVESKPLKDDIKNQLYSKVWKHKKSISSLDICLNSVDSDNASLKSEYSQVSISLSSTRLKLQKFQSVPSFIALTNQDYQGQSTGRESFNSSRITELQVQQYKDYTRLLKLTATELFQSSRYSNGTHIASGAFGAVLKVEDGSNIYAVKILQKSRNELDNPHLFVVYTEVSILEICKNDRRVTQMIDYGCTSDSYYIVMEYYPMTLKSWRKSGGEKPIPTMLRLYREFLNACTILPERKINHFDIKCDNVMLDIDGYPALADFGESMCYDSEKNCYTMLNKGTEWIKSPEMLSIALNSSSANPNYDRRHKIGAGPQSDIWSIGCLFYELITGEFLFLDQDWSRFFLRITDEKQELLKDEDKKLLSDDRFEQFLLFILRRNTRQRPNLHQIIVKFDEMFPEAANSPLPKFERG